MIQGRPSFVACLSYQSISLLSIHKPSRHYRNSDLISHKLVSAHCYVWLVGILVTQVDGNKALRQFDPIEKSVESNSIESGFGNLRVELGFESFNHFFPVLMGCQTPPGGTPNGMA
jgi:hypothetical protein